MTTEHFSPYAPVRLRTLGWWKFAQTVARDGLVTPKGMIASHLPDVIMQRLVTPMMQMAAPTLKQEGHEEALGQLFAKLLLMRQWIPLVAQYELCGKQIFDMDDALVTMLRMTDVEDCQLEQWNAPYDAFYVRFGPQEDMKLQFGGEEEFEYLDGAFVAVTPWDDAGTQRRLKIGLCTVKKDGSGVQMPGYFVDLTPEELRLSPAAAVDAFIERKCAELDADKGISDKLAGLQDIRKDEYREGAKLLKDAVALVVNSLFFIESMGADKPLSPGRDVSPEHLVQWQQAPELRKFKASQKLTREGYVMVHMVRDPSVHLPIDNDHGHVGVATHWRRGHWRRQHHGPQNSLIKRIWLRPLLVNPGEAPLDRPGHVYVVGGAAGTTH